jgi:hypothetical protein
MSKPRKEMQADPDYRAAWKACGARLAPSVWGNEEIDLRADLDELLKSGWSMKALTAYASTWRKRGFDHTTPSAWRWAIYFAHYDLDRDASLANRFLKDFLKWQQENHANTTPETVSALSV